MAALEAGTTLEQICEALEVGAETVFAALSQMLASHRGR
jgi:hypothetical protein